VKARLVMVTWHDAHSTAADDYDEAKHHQPCVMYTVGWLMKKDEAGVTVACERYMENEEWRYRAPTFIPSGMVVKVGKP
jgi:hypothetical protein